MTQFILFFSLPIFRSFCGSECSAEFTASQIRLLMCVRKKLCGSSEMYNNINVTFNNDIPFAVVSCLCTITGFRDLTFEIFYLFNFKRSKKVASELRGVRDY